MCIRDRKNGNRVEIEASIPFLIETSKGKTKLTSPDWFPLSGKQTTAKGGGKDKSEDKGKDEGKDEGKSKDEDKGKDSGD